MPSFRGEKPSGKAALPTIHSPTKTDSSSDKPTKAAATKSKTAADGKDGLPSLKDKKAMQKMFNKISDKSHEPQTQIGEILDDGKVLPFTEADFRKYKEAFLRIDADGSGELSWGEVKELGGIVGREIDWKTFKKMDKDRSGKIDFEEMLRCVFVTAHKRDIVYAIKRWGAPGESQEVKVQVVKSEDDWRDKFDDQSLDELVEIFSLFHGGNEGRLTKAELRKNIPKATIPDDIFDDVWDQYDSDKAGGLTLPQFAAIMEDTYMSTKNKRPEVKLYFQD